MTFSCIKFRRKFRIKFNLNTASDAGTSECKSCDNVSITSIVKNKAVIVSNETVSKPFIQVNTGVIVQEKYNEEVVNKPVNVLTDDTDKVVTKCTSIAYTRKNPSNDNEDITERTNLNASTLYDTINMESKIKEHLYCPLKFHVTAAINKKITNNGSTSPKIIASKENLSYMNINKTCSKDDGFYVEAKRYYDKSSMYCDYYENEDYDEIDYHLSQNMKKANDKEASLDSDYSINGAYNFDTFSCTTVYNFNGSSTSF